MLRYFDKFLGILQSMIYTTNDHSPDKTVAMHRNATADTNRRAHGSYDLCLKDMSSRGPDLDTTIPDLD